MERSTMRMVTVALTLGALATGCGKGSRAACEQAYDEQLAATRTSLAENAKRYPTVKAKGYVAYGEREGFLGRCSAVSPEVARCVSESYARQHLPECQPFAAEIRALNSPTPLEVTAGSAAPAAPAAAAPGARRPTSSARRASAPSSSTLPRS